MQDSLNTMTADPRAEFSRLLEQHSRIVFKVANSYAWNPHDRADLAQEIAAQLWRAFPAYDGDRPFATWMYRIALNVAISQVRDRRQLLRHTVPLEEQEHELAGAGADPLESDQRIRELHRVMAALDQFNRALLLLYLDGHGNREIGEILGLSETNVSTRISRLRQRLRERLA